MQELVPMLSLGAAIGCALVAGALFVFSNFVMRALGQLRPSEGIAAMQAINVTVQNPLCALLFFGSAVLCLVLAYLGWSGAGGQQQALLLSAAALYLIGCIGLTGAFNVPLNERLAKLEAHSPEAQALWGHYLVRWTRWNHARTLAALAAAVLFMLSR